MAARPFNITATIKHADVRSLILDHRCTMSRANFQTATSSALMSESSSGWLGSPVNATAQCLSLKLPEN